MSKSGRHVKLSGPLTVVVCETLQTELSAVLEQADDIVLSVEPDAEIDLTFLQLLIAAGRSATARGKHVSLETPPAGAFAEAIRACGYQGGAGATSLDQIFAQPGRNA